MSLDSGLPRLYACDMEVQLTPDQQAFVRQAIESGRLEREDEAVQQALALWEERERRRIEILACVDRAEQSLARGQGRTMTTFEQVTQLAVDIRLRGMSRLATDRTDR